MDRLQAMFDGLSAGWQRERSATQMTLGGLIEVLEGMDTDQRVVGLGELDSYRGYYFDLAFEPDGASIASVLLKDCREAMGKTFTGYKGGDYLMGDSTPLWVAEYGSCGERLMAINENGEIETAPEDDD